MAIIIIIIIIIVGATGRADSCTVQTPHADNSLKAELFLFHYL